MNIRMHDECPLVSIVIACYNKEKYIGELLDSILNQTYKKLQVILVDDGSTDKTLYIVKQYQEKFISENMEFVLIRQDNMGVSLAVRNGLLRVKGKFVCMPDADDVLTSKYVEEMCSRMMEDDSVDWCVCDSNRTRWTTYIKEYTDDICESSRYQDLLERYILMCNYGMVWQLMIRTKYLKRIDVEGCLSLLGWTTTHEAPVWIPLICGEGKGVYVPHKLYVFRDTAGSLSNPGSVEKVLRYARLYREAIISSLNFCHKTDARYKMLAYLREYIEILVHAPVLKDYVCIMLSDKLIRGGFIDTPLDPQRILNEGTTPCYNFCVWLWRSMIPHFVGVYPSNHKREIVAYGALGKRATRMLPIINASAWKPTKLWDKNGGGFHVSEPKVSLLHDGDVILCFPISEDVISSLRKEVPDGVKIIYGVELDMLVDRLQYIDFPVINTGGAVSVITED